ADAGLAVRYDSNVVSRSLSNQVTIDREAAAIVYQVVDDRTSEVIKQFPEEAVLRRRAYFRTLELSKDAPTRLRATDRKRYRQHALPFAVTRVIFAVPARP